MLSTSSTFNEAHTVSPTPQWPTTGTTHNVAKDICVVGGRGDGGGGGGDTALAEWCTAGSVAILAQGMTIDDSSPLSKVKLTKQSY